MNIRPSTSKDVASMARVADASQVFPGEMLPEMISGFLSGNENHDIWLTYEAAGDAVGFCYTVPEKFTEGTWNMLAIGVHPANQGRGVGSAIVKHLEATLMARSQRVLIVDTSGAPEFKQAREFYRKNGYSEEARIRDFWATGIDKVIFRKLLSQSAG